MPTLLSNIEHYGNSVKELVAATYRNRRTYRSIADMTKATVLKAATHPNCAPRRWLSPRVMSLGVQGVENKVYLRRSTSDFLVFDEIWENAQYAQVKKWKLPVDARILDFGGNVGLASVYFNSILREAFFAIVEPDKSNCDMIRKNCKHLSAVGRLDLFEGFVAGAEGWAAVDRNEDHWGFKKAEPTEAGQELVRCFTVEQILENTGFDEIDLLKCDIEGAEREVFADCSAWIHRVRHLIVETHPPYSLDDLYGDLRAAGWNFEVSHVIDPSSCFLKQV
jgi:FkbM family methyltransferase